MDIFFKEYKEQLKTLFADNKEELNKIDKFIEKMIETFKRGTYNKDGMGIKETCKKLGIRHTYTAINAFLKNKQN